MEYKAGKYDVVVIGAGHAGCEAALASARLGCKTVIFSINLDSVANMPCNPNIGGTAKGHLVREIDALGGEMGKCADKTFIQSRILNSAKGPAVYSLRAQVDRQRYQTEMKKTLERQENLDIKQAEIVDLLFDGKKVCGVKTYTGAIYDAKAVVIATGTFLGGKIIIGDISFSSGPDGMFPANKLTDCLKEKGIDILRFKTGTPPRVKRSSIDFSKMEEQPGDPIIEPFSFETDEIEKEQISCWLTYTNSKTHEIIRENLHRSPLYSGQIEGIGTRYCPSIEDKVVRFADKERHQVFIEPMGLDTDEMYVQGLSTSLPEDVQEKILRSVPGLENVSIMRSGYAIEYDCIRPDQLKLSLEIKELEGVFAAGQINGSSGYEEAAGQGLIAGINAAFKVMQKSPFTLDRSDAYLGVLIDDIVTKSLQEPYRIMTSRAEYRLLLRQDNADLRLTQMGYDIGLISEERYRKFLDKKKAIEQEIEVLKRTIVAPTEEVNSFLKSKGSSQIISGASLYDLLKRPEIKYEDLKTIAPNMKELEKRVQEQVAIAIKYEGYIKRQKEQIEKFKRTEQKKIPEDIDYSSIYGLSIEAQQKLSRLRPESIGRASRIAGISPADINILFIYLQQFGRKKAADEKNDLIKKEAAQKEQTDGK